MLTQAPHNQHSPINQIPVIGAYCYRSQKMKPFSIVVRSAGLEARETCVQIPTLLLLAVWPPANYQHLWAPVSLNVK